MRQLKYLKQLEPFHQVPFFAAEEAERQDIPRHALAYLVKKGALEKVYPGAYRFSEYKPESGQATKYHDSHPLYLCEC